MVSIRSVKGLHELLDSESTGRRLLDQWLTSAAPGVVVLDTTSEAGANCLEAIQVTTRSPLGAVAHTTGGILTQNGWLRILGAGSSRFTRTLSSWNRKGAAARISGAFLVGDDAVGGFFALNGGRFGQTNSVFYFAPDDLQWQDLEVGYSDWLQWAFSGAIDSFYEGLRWPSWREDIGRIDADQSMLIYPFPSADGGPVDQRERTPVAVEEVWSLYVERLATPKS